MPASLARYPDLAGRTVFVSGGASGIGAAFVPAFAGQDARVAFIDSADTPASALAAELGERVRYWHRDVRDIAALQETTAEAGRALGPISWMRGRPAMVGYTSSKAAIHGMTRVLARELGERGIRVNAIVPRAISTARQQALWTTPEAEREFLEQQCLKFRLSADDVARTALFLASDEARAITGHALVVDGGLAQTSVAS